MNKQQSAESTFDKSHDTTPDVDVSQNAKVFFTEILEHGYDGLVELAANIYAGELSYLIPATGKTGVWIRRITTADKAVTLWRKTNPASVWAYLTKLKALAEAVYFDLWTADARRHQEGEQRSAQILAEHAGGVDAETGATAIIPVVQTVAFVLPDKLAFCDLDALKEAKKLGQAKVYKYKPILAIYRLLNASASRRRIEEDLRAESLLGTNESRIEFDQWRLKIPCLSGWIEFSQTGAATVTPITADDRLTWVIPQFYDPVNPAKDEAFEKIFYEVHGDVTPESEYGNSIQMIFAAPLLRAPEQFEYFVNAFGRTGSNGKTLIREAIENAVGQTASRQIPENLLITPDDKRDSIKTSGGPTMDFETLFGSCYGFHRESPESARLNESVVKTIASGESFPSRVHHGEFRNKKTTPIIFLYGNYPLKMNSKSPAIRRRHVALLYPNRYISVEQAENEKIEFGGGVRKLDAGLKFKLLENPAAVFAFLVDGCKKLFKRGLNIPKDSREFHDAEQAAFERMFPLETHFEKCYEVGGDDESLTGADCLRVFRLYLDRTGHQYSPPKRFADVVRRYTNWSTESTRNGGVSFVGVRVKPEFDVVTGPPSKTKDEAPF